jgi:flagellar hook-associated protein 2
MSSLTSVNLNALYSAFGSSSNGIDVAAAVSQILYADRAPERQWQAQQQSIDQQTAALNQMNRAASALTDSLTPLQDPNGSLVARNTTSTDPSLVTATAAAGTAAGNHVIDVQHLATTASWYSDAVKGAGGSFAAGRFDLTVGIGSSQTTTTIAIGSGVDTPDQLAKYINGLSLGVTATVVTDANGSRVALVSNSSGSASDFSISPASGNQSSNIFTRAATGSDASLTVDGVPVSSATNTVTRTVSGVTFNLFGQAPGTEVSLTVGADADQASQAINAFISAYNTLLSQVNSQFAYNSTSQTSGPLSGDSTVRMLQSELLAAISYSAAGADINSLRSLGITMNDDGSLGVDSATLSSAIQNHTVAVQTFFQGTSLNGFAANLKNVVDTFADPGDGAFTVDLKSLSDQKTDYQNHIDDFERYLATEQMRLTNEYNQANILLLQLPAQQKQIDAMLGTNYRGSNG